MYSLTDLTFSPGDVAVDVGAHIGGVSILLATLHPADALTREFISLVHRVPNPPTMLVASTVWVIDV